MTVSNEDSDVASRDQDARPQTEAGVGATSPTADFFARAMGGREAFERGFHARTFSPERRSAQELLDAETLCETGSAEITGAGGTPEMLADWQARFLRLWVDYQRSGARVMNWMITGPARFAVDRNRKRMDVERRRGEEFYAHAKGARAWVSRRLRSIEKAAKSAEAATVEHAEIPFPGGRLVKNVPLDRIQLVFDGKPSPEVIAQLKARAFRWSPREGAWQRQLTRNGVWAAEFVIASIAKTEG